MVILILAGLVSLMFLRLVRRKRIVNSVDALEILALNQVVLFYQCLTRKDPGLDISNVA